MIMDPLGKPFKAPFQKKINWKDVKSTRLEDLFIYRKLIEKLIYLNITRPNIAFSMRSLRQFIHK